MKINFGCGKKARVGWYNVDAVHRPGVDLVHAMTFDGEGRVTAPLPLPDGCADEVCSFHVVEHFFRWEAPSLLREFLRLLQPGGCLILELPNIEAAARNLLNGERDQMCMWPLYGDWSHRDPYMMHKHGYTPRTIIELLAESGFVHAIVSPPQTHGGRANRDMRATAHKPRSA